jgi:hypothetical protein
LPRLPNPMWAVHNLLFGAFAKSPDGSKWNPPTAAAVLRNFLRVVRIVLVPIRYIKMMDDLSWLV